MKFIAQMVGRNEEGRYLREVLEDIDQYVDLIVFTDDASDDATPDIALDYGAEVYHTSEPMFTKSEGEFRQFAWNNLQKHAEVGDWVLSIDCDEIFYPGDNFDYWLKQSRWDVIGVKFYHMWNETHYRVDKAWRPTISSRLFRYYLGGSFRKRKLACGSEPDYVLTLIRRGKFKAQSGLRMKHLGYMRDEDKKAKYERYMELDKGDFHSLQHIESILDEDPQLVEWAYG